MDEKVKNYAGWQSDVIVDLIQRYDFPHITLNPGPGPAPGSAQPPPAPAPAPAPPK